MMSSCTNGTSSIRFCFQYPDYTTFQTQVIGNLLFAEEPVFGWETLYKLLFRRFKNNEFLSEISINIDFDMQEVLDRTLPKYNYTWDINASDYLKNLTYEEYLNEGLFKEDTTEDEDRSRVTDIDRTLQSDKTTDLKDSPQTKDVVSIDTDYLSQQIDETHSNTNTFDETATTTIDRVLNKTQTQNYVPIYGKIANEFKTKVTYEFEQFYRDIMDVFVKVRNVRECVEYDNEL